MDVTPATPKDAQNITGYGEGGFKINQTFTQGSLLVFADRHLRWEVNEASVITLDSLQAVLHADPAIELLLIGTGNHMVMIHPDIREAFTSRHIAIDVMNTGAACRTYNILLSEGRRAAAAVIAV